MVPSQGVLGEQVGVNTVMEWVILLQLDPPPNGAPPNYKILFNVSWLLVFLTMKYEGAYKAVCCGGRSNSLIGQNVRYKYKLYLFSSGTTHRLHNLFEIQSPQ